MGKYMTFLFDTEALRKLIEKNPDYVLVNVGYKLIPNPDDPSKQVAQLTVDAQGCTKTVEGVLDTVDGCPVPPCVAP
jgi:hypothetical protein